MTTKHIITGLSSLLTVAAPVSASETTDSTEVSERGKVQVAYRKVDSSSILGGVSVIDMEELQKKNYMNSSTDNLQGFVGGWNGTSLWGMDSDNDGGYLVLVDGVPRDANNVQPSEISEITFLKGAQAVVLYGSRAAKGAIYITTKRGKNSPLDIEVSANTGWYVAKRYPEYLGAAEYMTLYNEARKNDGLDALYSQNDIYQTSVGTNQWRYPDVNFYSSDYIRKAYNRTDADMQITGGNERAKFYTNINYYHTDDWYKFGEANDNNTNRFSVRGNVDLNISSWVSAYVDAAAAFYNSRSAKGNYWSEAASMRPNRISPLIPISLIDPAATDALRAVGNTINIIDNKYFLSGTQIDNTNIFADYYAAGYNRYTSRQFQFDTGVNLNLGQLVKGLTFRTMFAVDYATSYTTSFNNEYQVFIPSWSGYNGNDCVISVMTEGIDKRDGVQYVSGSTSRQTMQFSGLFDYARTFGRHNVHAMALASGWQQTTAAKYHRTSNVNVGFQADYNYDNRYYADFGIAGIHSAKMAPGHRQAWSPSLSLGWRLSQEGFLKDSPIVDELRLSVSASNLHTDLDIPDYYLYTANYTQGDWFSWNDGLGYKVTFPQRGSNPALDFIKRKELSVNLRSSLFDRMIDVDASFFVNKMEGLLISSSTIYPLFFTVYRPAASFVPYTNYNDNRRTGLDFSVRFNKNIDNVNLQFGLSGTYYDTKALKRDENYEESYQLREGRPLDGIWGYRSEGFFNSVDEIAGWADQSALSGDVKPGDIKYTDINNDGVIDSKDQVFLGKGGWYGSPFTLGANLTLQWRGFTFFALGVGNFGAKAVKNNSYYWVYGDRKYSAEVRNRWTPETAGTATYPRLTTTSGSNNFVTSDFWLYSTDAFRIAKIQLSYDLPESVFKKIFLSGASLYVSGSNLLTIGKNHKILETNVGSAPATRFYNVGARLTF
ncbi:MAG: SusC/RagA family TonB-linked outer membrane protein [Duncaniella sp.]|nr:SusC/RagA family TonB-linked outer membrane protein [Duncaniella sp.]